MEHFQLKTTKLFFWLKRDISENIGLELTEMTFFHKRVGNWSNADKKKCLDPLNEPQTSALNFSDFEVFLSESTKNTCLGP